MKIAIETDGTSWDTTLRDFENGATIEGVTRFEYAMHHNEVGRVTLELEHVPASMVGVLEEIRVEVLDGISILSPTDAKAVLLAALPPIVDVGAVMWKLEQMGVRLCELKKEEG